MMCAVPCTTVLQRSQQVSLSGKRINLVRWHGYAGGNQVSHRAHQQAARTVQAQAATDLSVYGCNIAWNNYGWDFGSTYWYDKHWQSNVATHVYNGAFFSSALKDLQSAGAKVARVFMHGDGRTSPMFSRQSRQYDTVFGNDLQFLDNLDDLINSAKGSNVKLVLVLWDFLAMGWRSSAAGGNTPQMRQHAPLFTNDDCTAAYIQNCLTPLIKRYSSISGVLAWDIINEPEWCIPESGDFKSANFRSIPLRKMQAFVGKSMRQEALQRWAARDSNGHGRIAELAPAGEGWSFWDDIALQSATGNSKAFLDFYSIHHYDYMIPDFSPFSNPAKRYVETSITGLSKPMVVGECQSNLPSNNTSNLPVDQYNTTRMKTVRDNGYSGLMFWSYQFDPKPGGWEDFKGIF